MKFTELKLSGVFKIEAEPFIDDRGVFRRHFCQEEFSNHNIATNIQQANVSENKYIHTLRGFHYQEEPSGEGKTLSCLRGSIFDIVVDLRETSPTYMQWVSIELNPENRLSVHIPPGCANAFLTTAEDSLIHYYCSESYNPDAEKGIRYNDPAFEFIWPCEPQRISEKDLNIPDYKTFGSTSMSSVGETVFESIDRCRICDSKQLEEVINLGNQPPANSLYNDDSTKPPLVPLRLLFCLECSTVQLGESVQPEYLFSDYVWVTGTSDMAKEHRNYFLDNALSRSKKDCPSVVGIGSNDGTFLQRFKNAGCQVLGIDPAKNIAEQATKNGIPTIAEFFNEDVANKVCSDQGKADMVTARNVIPHVKEIHSVIKGIDILLDDEGIGIIEFHSGGLIMSGLHYDSIYHEHLFYFSLKTMTGLLKRHGLHVFDVTTSPISGGSWVVYFSKDIRPKSYALKQAENEEETTSLNSYETWLEFSRNVKKHSAELKQLILNQKAKILAYGASARSSTLLNYCEIDCNHISSIIDKNPMKHGLLTPGTKIPIISLKSALNDIKEESIILLLAWNLSSEVMTELRESNYNGKFIIPLPNSPKVVK